MEHPGFFRREGPFPLGVVAERVEAELPPAVSSTQVVTDVRALADAGPSHISFLDNRKYIEALQATGAGACLIAPTLAARAPATTSVVLSKSPYRSFALALQLFYPDAMHSKTTLVDARSEPAAVHPSAEIGAGAFIEAGAIIGREARIGPGTRISAGAVIGYRVVIGRDSYVGPSASVTHAILGDRVIIHAGARIGQDGFGFAMSGKGHLKVPQIGRVVISNDVEIGANSTVDRGALKDTVIGEGTKIDNLVQIGHNAVIGRHCVLVSYVGISGSTELGDFVVMGAKSGAIGHLKVGSGAQIAVGSHVLGDVAAGARMGGRPAVPFREHARAVAAVKRLARKGGRGAGEDAEEGKGRPE